ncbi:MAG: DUF4493 domain-containing protein [Candidatus Cryptobacteroides sp.]
MRRLRFLPVFLALLGTSCSKSVISPVESPEGDASLTIAITADSQRAQTKAEGEALEGLDINDFRIAIYKTENQMRLYNDSYANTAGKTLKLNAGEYRMVAQLGDSLGCGFGKPYFLADPTFEVERGANTLEAVAKLANVKLAINFDNTISEVYPDYYAIVKHNTFKGKQVKFAKGETRCGYIPAGELVLEVYADIEGTWKYYKTAPATYNPNDFVTFNITTNASEGGLSISITVDDEVNTEEKTITIPATSLPQDGPSITLAGFESEGNVHDFVEGMDPQGRNASANFIAKASIAHCYLTIESDYLAGKGVSGTVDFADLTSDSAIALKSAGFEWDANMAGTRTFSFIDFSNIIKNMLRETKAEKTDKVMARFSVRVVDAVGKEMSEEFSIVSLGVSLSLDIKDYNVWAARIESPVITFTNALPALTVLQSSTDGVNWNAFASEGLTTGNTINYGKVPCLPSTTYHIRAIYNGNTSTVSNALTVTTEAKAQVANAGFEDYQLVQTQFQTNIGGKYTRNWYLPYKSGETDPWWACNSLASMPNKHNAGASYWCKNFPSSGYVKDSYEGDKAALIFSVNVDGWNTDNSAVGNTTEGELWIGTADDSGNRTSEGHSFTSRPDKLSFHYKYEQKNSETFYVYSWIKDSEGQVIATTEETNGPTSDTWAEHTMTYNYTAKDKKAASIYILFRSCNGEGSVSTKKSFELGEETVTAHAGSMFKIDDIELIYE